MTPDELTLAILKAQERLHGIISALESAQRDAKALRGNILEITGAIRKQRQEELKEKE